jgi:hypothetical protein
MQHVNIIIPILEIFFCVGMGMGKGGHTDNIRALLLDSTGRLVEWGLQLLSFVCMRFFC